MDDGERPVGSHDLERLSADLAVAEDLDSLARTLLTGLIQPGGWFSVRGATLGLVEGGGRRMRLLFSDDDLGESGRRPAWTHIDAYDDVPMNHVVRTGEPVLGCDDTLGETYLDFVRTRREQGSVSLAVLPLEQVVGRSAAGEEGPFERPLGALLLCYDECREFGPGERSELARLARIVSHALRELSADRGWSPAAPVDPRGDGAAEAATMLPNDERAPATARRFLRERLRAWDVPVEAAATAELCLSEVVTNVVIHTGSSSHLLVALVEGELRVCVRDHGGPPRTHELVTPIEAADASMRVYGRGLMLVEALTSEWGADTMEDGTSVWFTLALDDAG